MTVHPDWRTMRFACGEQFDKAGYDHGDYDSIEPEARQLHSLQPRHRPDMQFLPSALVLISLSTASVHAHPQARWSQKRSPVTKAEIPPIFRRQLPIDPSACATECTGENRSILFDIYDCQQDNVDLSVGIACQCKQMTYLYSVCATCVLNHAGVTPSAWESTCAAASSAVRATSIAGTTTVTTTTAQPAVTAIGVLCPSDCATQADANGIQELETCIDGDVGCFCASTSLLSSTCFACVITQSDVTTNQLAEICSAYSATAAYTAMASRNSTALADGAGTTTTTTAGSATNVAGGGGSDAGTTADGSSNPGTNAAGGAGGGSGTTAGGGGGSGGGTTARAGSGSGTTAGGASGARTSAASATSTTRSAASKITVGEQVVFLAGAFMLVGGLMVLL
ncbi:hypothetical protein CALVIDRAFT_598216 [Calocera viscosa TUFC12733]|uniref:Uncharacterized protein n=1 Tax=Calocera viscosa (strain TUFC12733) TaxID=1330018 RepID=A0A167MFF2_CALVF|nr:hypothetical protein CALVIDRAFT_598216 [Calocera viscosa TUFC12733]